MSKQLSLNMSLNQHGGARKGAGRPNRSRTVNHMKRPKVTLKTPLHLTLKLKEKLPTLRQKRLLNELIHCVKKARSQALFVIHFSIQHNHIHLFAESPDNKSLALGMRSLVGRFAKIMRTRAHQQGYGPKKGSVFAGRYHLHALKTPSEVKNALKYVLLNFSKHEKLIEHIDTFSSARFFKDWSHLVGNRFRELIREDALFYKNHQAIDWGLSPPRSWLSTSGWMRA